jgi:hypothetical protein
VLEQESGPAFPAASQELAVQQVSAAPRVSAVPQALAAPQSFVGMQAPALLLGMTGLQEPMMGLDPTPDSLRLLVEMIAPRSSKTQLSVPMILRGSHSAKPSELAMLSPPVYERDATFSRSSSDAERFEFFDLLR